MTELSIGEAAEQAKTAAAIVVDRHVNPTRQHVAQALYSVLGNCLKLVKRIQMDAYAYAELKKMFLAQPHTNVKGRWLEKGSDAFVLVCRYVFTETDRTNAMRYAQALREADKLQIAADDLAGWLKRNGGVNALYMRRPLNDIPVQTKTLRLTRSILFKRTEPFTVTLQWNTHNAFRVIRQTGDDPGKLLNHSCVEGPTLGVCARCGEYSADPIHHPVFPGDEIIKR